MKGRSTIPRAEPAQAIRSVSLESVATLISGQSPPSSDYNRERRGLPFYQGKAEFGERYPVARTWCDKPVKRAKAGDILISVRAPVGPTNIAREECCIGRGLSAIRPGPDADLNYLIHAIKFREKALASMGAGSTFEAVTQKQLAGFEIPIPASIREQKRLAAILDHADGIRRKRQQALRLVDDFLRSVFLDMFGDPVENAKGWERKSLNRLGRVITGNTPPSTLEGAFGGDIPFVTPGDLNESWTASKRTLTQLGATRARLVRKGTTLVCCIGATIGKMGKTVRRSAFNQQINAVEWADEWMDAYGLECLKFFKNAIAAAGTSTTLPILNKSSFERFEIPAPPRSICLDFSTIVNQMEAIKTVLERSALETNDLFQSLQHRAFSGQL